MKKVFSVFFLLLSIVSLSAQSVQSVWLDDLPIKAFSQGIPAVVAKKNQGGEVIRMAGNTYLHGVGVASTSILFFHLKGNAVAFSATIGVDDMGVKDLPHKFYVLGDKKILYESPAMQLGDAPLRINVNLQGVQKLGLLVLVNDEGRTRVFSNWADASLTMLGNALPEQVPTEGEKYILTPPAASSPRINSPSRFGARPGNPFLYTIVATGEKSILFSVDKLPEGLSLDPVSGIISGRVTKKGKYNVLLRARNAFAQTTKQLVISIGDTIALTPPMGWNGWNSWARSIDREKVLASANAMVRMGLKDHGWSYVNIDDAWQGVRGGPLNALQPNEKFPQFKNMIDSIHAMGLKLGVYSTPWITSYAGYAGGSTVGVYGAFPDSVRDNKRAYRYIGKYRFENEDARQMAEWGVDFLKYDWRIDVNSAERMSNALKTSGRDIVLSLSNSAPFAQVKDWIRLSNMYRTGPDIRDSWHALYKTNFTLNKWAPYAGPGHWNDPDMMILGNVTTGIEMHPTRLTPDEQYSHISMNALLSAPMLIGCPIEQLDAFTLSLLTNDEVIAVNQDPLGKSARLVLEEGGVQVWLKELEDGAYALGLFNTAGYGQSPATYFRWGDEMPAKASLVFSRLGLKGRWKLRDLWRQKELGIFDRQADFTIPHHGVVLLKLSLDPASLKNGGKSLWLDDLEIQSYSEGIRPVKAKRNYQEDSMRMKGTYFERGVGLQSISVLSFMLEGHAKKFSAVIGADDNGNKSIPVRFYVVGDGKVLFESKDMHIGDTPQSIEVDLTGIQRLGLLVRDTVGGISNKRTYANWANAQLLMLDDYLPQHFPNNDERYILTPPSPRFPRINTPKVYGATPGNPFLFRVSTTGERPMVFSAEDLPEGLTLNPHTGIITGTVLQRGHYTTTLRASNAFGEASSKLLIKIGDTIALTPPMGWNGWNCWEQHIDREKVIASTDAMVSKGLADHGWTYINIDDAWQGVRGGSLNALQPNHKFPRIKEMFDYIHSLGLKGGIYSTPYISSYAGYAGASSDYPNGGESHESIMVNRRAFNHIGPYRFEENDARQMAEWGVDFIKYDWRIDVNSAERMSAALKKSGRDIVYSLSNSAPFDKAKDWMRVSNMYRTGPDIKDSWNSLFMTTFSIDKWAPYAGPGHWPDPDMMIVGDVRIGPNMHPTRLTPDEQYSHVSLFSLLSAPLLIGAPIEQLDTFTVALLSNHEVIAVNQDPLGKPARLVKEQDGVQTWLKQLHDGTYAVGFFNIDHYGETPQSYFRWGNEKPRTYRVDLAGLGLEGTWIVRDVWRQKDLGKFVDTFSVSIRHHGVQFFKLIPASTATQKEILERTVMPDSAIRINMLRQQWAALRQTPPRIAVRDCFLFLLDALDLGFLTQEEVLWTINTVKTRVITDSTKPSYGNMYWGWTETGGDVGDGNNVEFCVQYGSLIKLLFNDRLSVDARASLDELFSLALVGVRRLPVRISYTNIYLMRVWNMVALGQIYQRSAVVEEARQAFDAWLKHIARYGNREYDSPTYSGVDLESLLLIYRFAADDDLQQKAFDALHFFLTDLAAHYNARGGYLAGAHSRDYNRVFGRDLFEEKYMNPLLGFKNNNTKLFHQVCFSILKDLGLSEPQQRLMRQTDKFILQRWDSLPHAYAYDYHGKKFSIASSNQYYSPDDKSFVMYLNSDRIPAMPNIVYVPEGRDDHYGTWAAEGMGEKMKGRMPPNYPANGGWNKVRHLMPFMQTVQHNNEFVMLVAGTKDHNCINDYLNSTIVLPNYFDEIWMGNKRVVVPAIGKSIAFNEQHTLFARFEDVAIAIRFLWSNAAKQARPVLYNDGFRYKSNRELFELEHNKTLRVTLKHPTNAPLHVSMWWKAEECIDNDEKFAAFRKAVLSAPVSIADKNGVVDIAVETASGKLGLKANLTTGQRLEYHRPVPLPNDFLFQVNGKEIGQPIMDRYKKQY